MTIKKELGLFFLLGFFSMTSMAATLDAPAPAFSLHDSHQQFRTLKSYQGQVVFLDFWASWCAPCLLELPELNRLAADYQKKKLRVLAINVDTDPAAAKVLLSKLGLKKPVLKILWDTQSKVVSTYNIETMPASFIIDQKGIIRFSHPGYHEKDPSLWRTEIDGLLR
jgi:thiol-disulfide isomerase/thioredoxin